MRKIITSLDKSAIKLAMYGVCYQMSGYNDDIAKKDHLKGKPLVDIWFNEITNEYWFDYSLIYFLTPDKMKKAAMDALEGIIFAQDGNVKMVKLEDSEMVEKGYLS